MPLLTSIINAFVMVCIVNGGAEPLRSLNTSLIDDTFLVIRRDQLFNLPIRLLQDLTELLNLVVGLKDVTLSWVSQIVKMRLVDWVLFLQLNFELDILRLNAAQLDCQIIDLLRLFPKLSFEVYHGLSTDFIDTVLP